MPTPGTPEDCEFDVVLTHVAGCPVYADLRRLSLFSDGQVLLDAEAVASSYVWPHLRVRAAV